MIYLETLCISTIYIQNNILQYISKVFKAFFLELTDKVIAFIKHFLISQGKTDRVHIQNVKHLYDTQILDI